MERALAAKTGDIPKWGQSGVFKIVHDGIPYLIEHPNETDTLSGAIYAATRDTKFPSSTGYHSMLGYIGGMREDGSTSAGFKGLSVEDAWRAIIDEYRAGNGQTGSQRVPPAKMAEPEHISRTARSASSSWACG